MSNFNKYVVGFVDEEGDWMDSEECETEADALAVAKDSIRDNGLEIGHQIVIYKAIKVVKISDEPIVQVLK